MVPAWYFFLVNVALLLWVCAGVISQFWKSPYNYITPHLAAVPALFVIVLGEIYCKKEIFVLSLILFAFVGLVLSSLIDYIERMK